ncbi:CLOCK-interacting pacemaker [Liparis tanakae]|uniref:CLOCK-interacting pacemaker n=1 Tax=Liparis tanakae TaxID=230148 RepID=A0A4Z2HEM3_9TELE|nr:CLOCK-interacting pacemaker [Liparis tanakae]
MSAKRKADSHLRVASRLRLMKFGGTRADSERDSGFSDASSEHMSTMDNTDSEGSPRRRFVRKAPQTSGSVPQSSQLAVVGGSYSSLSPMIIMNNVLLKQPRDGSPALKPWRFGPAVEVVQPAVQQPQVVFLQPVVSRQASPASKDASSRHRRPKKYLPILKSYPKIAPHPGDGSSSSGRGTASSSFSSSFHSSSSSSSGSERRSSLTSNNREHCPREKHKRNPSGGASDSAQTPPSVPATPSTTSPLLQSRLSLPPTGTSAGSSPATERPSSVVPQAEVSTSPSVPEAAGRVLRTPPREVSSSEECPDGDGGVDSKRKRFCNTYNILSKSGLLDIALRTKELHRQNRRSQSDLNRLKEHTDLFLRALCSGDAAVWVKLQADLQEEEPEEGRERAAQTGLKTD